MRFGSYQFTPGFWPTMATLILLPLFIVLGFWQLDRADQKSREHEDYLRRQSERALDLNDPASLRAEKQELLWRHAQASGRFDTAIHILLDNQVVKGEAGYFVFTPFCVSPGNYWVLVNRGWVPLGADRIAPPPLATPGDNIKIEGVINDVPATGLLLHKAPAEVLAGTIYRCQRIDLEEATGPAGHKLVPFVLTLATESGYGFVRDWQMPGSGKEVHLGYAFQWFFFAVILVVIYVSVNMKKMVKEDE